MTIVFQKNLSEKNKFSKDLETIVSKTGALRENTSIVNPTVRVQGAMSDFAECNYMSIPEFSRSYFITDIVSVGLGVVELTGHCDVLTSFASQILTNRAVVSRQEKAFNRYLNDNLFKIYQNNEVVTAPLSGSGFEQAGFILVTAGVTNQ